MPKKPKDKRPFWELPKEQQTPPLQKKKPARKPVISKGKPEAPPKKEEPLREPDPREEVRLNRFIAQAGVCSRREADTLIAEGKIKVNGQIVTELGTRILPKRDKVEYQGKVLSAEKFVYILYNKPKNTITTAKDPLGRRTVIDAIEDATRERVFPVGRLDRNTTGLLLLTNDGVLAKKLTHPSHKVRKLYHVRLDKPVTEEDLQKLLQGVELEDGIAKADKADYVLNAPPEEVGIEIHIGRNRVVRRMFEALGYQVINLDRVMIAQLTKKNLPRGKWRELTEKEVNFLKMTL